MCAKRSKRTVGGPLEHSDGGIFFVDEGAGLIDVINIDTKMVKAGNITGLSPDDSHSDIAVADAQCIVRLDRLFFLHGSRLRSLHPKNSLIELALADKIFTDDGDVLNPSTHNLASPINDLNRLNALNENYLLVIFLKNPSRSSSSSVLSSRYLLMFVSIFVLGFRCTTISNVLRKPGCAMRVGKEKLVAIYW